MDRGLALLIIIGFAGAAALTLVAVFAWWMEPASAVTRILRQGLPGKPVALAVAPARSQGAALDLDEKKLAVVRGRGDPGLVYDLEELVGAELILDGHVAARMFRGEQRRPLDNIAPNVTRVTLRMVFDDPHDPEFEFQLYEPGDIARRDSAGPAVAVADARRWFTRLEAVLRQPTP
jgi:hypothetical protein